MPIATVTPTKNDSPNMSTGTKHTVGFTQNNSVNPVTNTIKVSINGKNKVFEINSTQLGRPEYVQLNTSAIYEISGDTERKKITSKMNVPPFHVEKQYEHSHFNVAEFVTNSKGNINISIKTTNIQVFDVSRVSIYILEKAEIGKDGNFPDLYKLPSKYQSVDLEPKLNAEDGTYYTSLALHPDWYVNELVYFWAIYRFKENTGKLENVIINNYVDNKDVYNVLFDLKCLGYEDVFQSQLEKDPVTWDQGSTGLTIKTDYPYNISY